MATGGRFQVPQGSELTVRQLQHILSDYPKESLDNPVGVTQEDGSIKPAVFINTSPNAQGELKRVVIGPHVNKPART